MKNKKNSFIYSLMEKLASIKLFFIISILLSIHFYIAVLGVKGGIDPGFKKLNQFILIDWISILGPDHLIILGWLIIALVFTGIFSLNITARVMLELNNLYSLIRFNLNNSSSKNLVLRKISVFLIHLSIVLMLFIHLLSSVTGTKFMGPVLKKGKILMHEKLEFPIEVVDIKKSGTKYSKPMIYLRNVKIKDSEPFLIPGWYKGVYYDVKASYVDLVENKKKRIGLKLFVHSLDVVSFLIFTSLLCLIGFLLHMVVRSENMGIVLGRLKTLTK